MDYSRYFDPADMVPDHYNYTLVEYHQNAITKDMAENKFAAFEILAAKYAGLSDLWRNGEYGMAVMEVITSALRLMLDSNGKLRAAGRIYFNKQKQGLVDMKNKTKAMDDLLKQECGRSYKPPSGVLRVIPMRAIELRCAKCMKTTPTRCTLCREKYYCGKECMLADNHTKRQCMAQRGGFTF